MIVEDEVVIAIGLRKRLQSMGYEVCQLITESDEVIRSVEKENPDLVVMDINIQGKKDGIELAKEVRSRFNVFVVFLSGYPDAETERRTQSVDHSGFFVKPVEVSTLHQAFQKALGNC